MYPQFLARVRSQGKPTPSAESASTTETALVAVSPDAPLAPSVIQRGLRLALFEGALSNVHGSLALSAFLTGFALFLGAREFQLGLIGALPFLGQFFQFAGAYLEERFGRRRRLTVLTGTLGRGLWAVFLVLPFLGLGGAQLTIFLVVLAISQALLSISNNLWTSWMTDLVPPRQRGRYFGTRNTVLSVVAMLTAWLAARVLDVYRDAGNEALGYAWIFGVAVVCAIIAGFVQSRQPEPPPRPRPPVRFRSLFGAPLRHHQFRAFCGAASGWALVTGIASPFFNAYGLQTLRLSFETLALFAIVTSAVALVTQPFIGRLQDRYGNRRVLIGSTVGVILLPWGWILATPTFLLPLWLTAIFSGFFWPGINQGLINLLMERAPAEGRSAYLAAYGATFGMGTFVAGLLGGTIAVALGTALIQLGPLELNHYALLFLFSSVGRGVMAFVFARRI